MSVPYRLTLVAGVLAVVVTLGACSSDDSDSADTVVFTEPTESSSEGPTNSHVVEGGDTLSGIAAGYGLTLDELVEFNDWEDGADHAIFPGDEIALPVDAVAVPTTRPPRTTDSGGNDDSGDGGSATTTTAMTNATGNGGYEATGQSYIGPDFGESTDPIVDPMPDGVYWSWTPSVSGDGSTIMFEVVQQFNGDECLEHFGTAPGTCSGDIEFESATATATMRVGSGTASVLFVNGIDVPEAFRVSTEELARLLAGQPPADDAPDEFIADLVDAFVVTVRNGSVVAADQIWIS
jgi:LysM repeat protein